MYSATIVAAILGVAGIVTAIPLADGGAPKYDQNNNAIDAYDNNWQGQPVLPHKLKDNKYGGHGDEDEDDDEHDNLRNYLAKRQGFGNDWTSDWDSQNRWNIQGCFTSRSSFERCKALYKIASIRAGVNDWDSHNRWTNEGCFNDRSSFNRCKDRFNHDDK